MTVSSDKPSSRSTIYHRFVPREEVQEATAWEFDSMDGNPKRRLAKVAEVEAPPALPQVDLEAERQDAFAQGYEQGRRAGEKETRDALDAPLRRTAQDAAQRLAQLLRNAQTELDKASDHLSEQLLELACDIARQVVRRELAQPLEPIRAVVTEALAATVNDDLTRTIRLNPMDFALLQNHIDGLIDTDHVKLVPDETITAGGCVLQTATGTVDGTVEKRWTRAVANLGLRSRWEAEGAPPAPQEAGDE